MLLPFHGKMRIIGYFPPPVFIPKVLKQMERGGEDGTITVPLWKSALWWPLLSADGLHPYSSSARR